MKKPRRKQVRDETFKLLTQNGLTGWHVKFNPKLTRALGRCCYSTKTIDYQPKFMDENEWDEVVLTIRHEVAHATAGRYAGHSLTWQRECLRLGGNGKRYNTTAKLSYTFKGTCPKCGREIQRNRRTQQACGVCCKIHNDNKFTSDFLFTWTRN